MCHGGRVPDAPSRAGQLGAIAFLLRPTYIATEVVTPVLLGLAGFAWTQLPRRRR